MNQNLYDVLRQLAQRYIYTKSGSDWENFHVFLNFCRIQTFLTADPESTEKIKFWQEKYEQMYKISDDYLQLKATGSIADFDKCIDHEFDCSFFTKLDTEKASDQSLNAKLQHLLDDVSKKVDRRLTYLKALLDFNHLRMQGLDVFSTDLNQKSNFFEQKMVKLFNISALNLDIDKFSDESFSRLISLITMMSDLLKNNLPEEQKDSEPDKDALFKASCFLVAGILIFSVSFALNALLIHSPFMLIPIIFGFGLAIGSLAAVIKSQCGDACFHWMHDGLINKSLDARMTKISDRLALLRLDQTEEVIDESYSSNCI